ncbi:SET domain-containing protein-lysine N-methyltransferase [Paenibacillus spongiae]|uniref:SET domain-containing protein-lysine N-methyltransferase n=1 Tax=Paenibacillus spongiae TaxID=2909671 RepID=A0ABY5S7E4_9BACL|nr:SET domain-containing protein-lysine N-methyltransferase [Paenibacillus spongiae]UVI28638.1 SET domain-containing protein-lysine N-methyltransferase [Paenibacillus spongiae]
MSLVAKIIQKIKLWIASTKPSPRDVSNTRPLFANNRFYPEEIPYREDEPSAAKFEIVHHNQYGDGVVSKIRFQAEQVLFRFSGNELPYQTLFTLQKKPGLYIEDPYFMGKILHSCNPNARVDMDRQVFIAIRAIDAGEYITMDYETTEDILFRQFVCECGSPKCRGLISGRSYRRISEDWR